MAIVGRTATVAELNTVTGITATLPTDRQAGDLCVVVFACDSTVATFTGPAGWTQLKAPQNDPNNNLIAAYYQFSPSSAPSASTSGAAGRWTAICQSYGGVHPTVPVDAAAVTTAGNGTTLAATGVTTATNNAMLLSAYMVDSGSRTLTQPGTMTMVKSYTPGAGGQGLALAQELFATAGATGTRTWSLSSTALDQTAFVLALAQGVGADATVSSTFGATVTAQTGTGVAVAEAFAVTVAASRNAAAAAAASSTFAASVDATVAAVSASTPITCTLEIELIAGVWTDITPYVSYERGPVTIRQGRPTEYDDVAGGVMSFALWNDDGRFMPGNTGSPLYPNFAKGKRVRWIVHKAGVDYTRFVGWIQAIAPEYPGDTTSQAVVGVTATDALGLLAQRKLRSNLTEVSLWRARFDGTWCDAYEASGTTSGQIATLTNYSENGSPGAPSALYVAADSALNFGTENDLSVGGVVTASGQQTTKTVMGLQASAFQIKLHLKGPTQQVPAAATFYECARFAAIGVLAVAQNGSDNSLVLRNDLNTSTVGTLGTLPKGQWVTVVAYARADNRARSDWQLILTNGTASTLSNVAVDIRNATAVWFPGNATPSLDCSASGVVALGSDTPVNYQEGYTALANGTVADRVDMLASAVDAMPVTIAQTGTLTGAVATGRWSDRPASEVLQEMLRTHSGLAWARSRDSAVYAIGSDQLYPTAVTATIDVDGDCIGSPRLVDGAEAQPTRVDAEWPGGVQTVRSATLETGGAVRSKRITTVAVTAAVATAAAQAVLNRGSGGIRVAQLELDLMSAANDLAPSVLSEATTLGGLFPTVRYRLVVPVSHFAVPTKDVHVQGWTETYGPDQARVRLDTSPAIPATLASEAWTGANGAAWPAQWGASGGGGAAGSTVDIQSNRGRLRSGAGGDVWRRLTAFTAADVEITGLVQVQGTAEAQLLWRADASLANGYALIWSASGGVRVQRIVSGTIANLIPAFGPAIAAGTDYRFRLRSQGKWLSIRTWAASGSEPGTWDLSTTNTLFLSAGYVALRQWFASQTCLFDDLAVTTGA